MENEIDRASAVSRSSASLDEKRKAGEGAQDALPKCKEAARHADHASTGSNSNLGTPFEKAQLGVFAERAWEKVRDADWQIHGLPGTYHGDPKCGGE